MPRLAAALLLALVSVPAATAAPPQRGVLLPGRSLGSLRLDVPAAQVRASWGDRHGVCRSCARQTWYFNYRPFEPQGAGAEFRQGRVAALFTLWQPQGWRTPEGLRLGDEASRLSTLYGPLPRVSCAGYAAFVLRRGRVRTAFYVHDNRLWGFGLLAARVAVCRDG